MTDQPEKLDLRSQDIAEDKRQEILRLFPEIRTEGGNLDFERLKLALGETVDADIRDERTPDDLLYELLLKSGFPLTTPVEKLQIARGDAETQRNKKSVSSAPPREPFIVYSVAGGASRSAWSRN